MARMLTAACHADRRDLRGAAAEDSPILRPHRRPRSRGPIDVSRFTSARAVIAVAQGRHDLQTSTAGGAAASQLGRNCMPCWQSSTKSSACRTARVPDCC